MARRLKVGDLLEVPISQGFAYAQITHFHPTMGELVRVLQGVFPGRPNDFDALAEREHQFVAFIPAKQIVNRKIFEVVSNAPVPPEARTMPLFRGGNTNREGQISRWWLWDGEKDWWVGELTPEIAQYPRAVVWTDVTLVCAIEQNYRPKMDHGQGPKVPVPDFMRSPS